MSKSLAQKTVRPGSLNNYSFYYSNRNNQPVQIKQSRNLPWKKMLAASIVLGVAFLSFAHSSNQSNSLETIPQTNNASAKTSVPAEKPKTKSVPAAATTNLECTGNSLPKFISVNVGKRKLTACEGAKAVFSAPVITGDERYVATETPEGTYKIFAKESKITLKGADDKGAWSFPVDYWMPFLENEHGTYGFHDAGWKAVSDFGNVDPYTSDKASHGCVELTKDASAWLYGWAEVGTTLQVKA